MSDVANQRCHFIDPHFAAQGLHWYALGRAPAMECSDKTGRVHQHKFPRTCLCVIHIKRALARHDDRRRVRVDVWQHRSLLLPRCCLSCRRACSSLLHVGFDMLQHLLRRGRHKSTAASFQHVHCV